MTAPTLQSQDPKQSPLGDRRERAVLCVRCRVETWNIDGRCDRCRKDET